MVGLGFGDTLNIALEMPCGCNCDGCFGSGVGIEMGVGDFVLFRFSRAVTASKMSSSAICCNFF